MLPPAPSGPAKTHSVTHGTPLETRNCQTPTQHLRPGGGAARQNASRQGACAPTSLTERVGEREAERGALRMRRAGSPLGLSVSRRVRADWPLAVSREAGAVGRWALRPCGVRPGSALRCVSFLSSPRRFSPAALSPASGDREGSRQGSLAGVGFPVNPEVLRP